ncbi:MAG: IS66 family transposase [Chitinophagaceae bacterium]|nr:MAG: IS66 family transposase [Chitinophagaceae bacterium]
MLPELDNLSKQALIELIQRQYQQAKDLENNTQELQKNTDILERQSRKYEKQSLRLERQSEHLQQENLYLREQIAKLRRMKFGQQRERFIMANQPTLPFELPVEEKKALEEQTTEKITYERKKVSSSTHPGRVPLPEHLPVEEVDIHPEEDTTDMVCIGVEVSEQLEYRPASYVRIRYNRYKYAAKSKEGKILIGSLPAKVIEKGIAGPGLLASILVDKYTDHLPLYRQLQRFKRESIPIAASTLEGWTRQGLKILDILYEHLLRQTRAKGYLQADESPIKVQDKDKKGSCHQGYYWVYHCPLDGTVLFDYQPGRGSGAAAHVLEGFKGFLQSDGYAVYDKIGARDGVTHVGCWAHARREFNNALDNDKDRASIAMGFIQTLYKVEADAREQGLSAAARKELRLQKSLPHLNAFGKWLAEEIRTGTVLPRSATGKAISYTHERWDKLSAYLYDGSLEIDNNLVENAIRPLALGRKNYLFAGSHEAAKRAACIYSFFAMCRKEEVNPFEWLRHVFTNIMDTKVTALHTLYPKYYKENISK